jgi:Flp pilus assembly pilin Flp
MEKKVKNINWLDERGATTAEYAIITLAAVGFAGILLAILRSEEVKGMLLDLIRSALSVSGN